MTKVKVLDMQVCDENKMVFMMNSDELFEDWKSYYNEIKNGYGYKLGFTYRDIDKKVFIIDDGGELIRLKNGKYVNICWRGDMCAVWYEDDEDMIKFYNEKLNVKE